jgi:excisionase family DNA binding protein
VIDTYLNIELASLDLAVDYFKVSYEEILIRIHEGGLAGYNVDGMWVLCLEVLERSRRFMSTFPDSIKLLSVRQAAKKYGVSCAEIVERIGAGNIAAQYVNAEWVIFSFTRNLPYHSGFLFSVKQVASLLNVSREKIIRYIHEGKLPAQNISGVWVICERDLYRRKVDQDPPQIHYRMPSPSPN